MAAKKKSTKGMVKFAFNILGSLPQDKAATKGATAGHLRQKFGLADLPIRANGVEVDDSYIIKDGDRITVLTQVKSG